MVLVRARFESAALIGALSLAVFYGVWFGAMLWLRHRAPHLGERG